MDQATALAARHARRTLPGALPPALAMLCPPDPAGALPEEKKKQWGDALWAAAGLGAALNDLLKACYARAGRDVTQTIFALHDSMSGTKLGESKVSAARTNTDVRGQAMKLEAHAALDPYAPLMARWAAQPALRAVWHGWLEVMAERLTLMRYNERRHRRGQAKTLIVAPLAALAGQITPAKKWSAAEDAAALDCAEILLRYADLAAAEELAARGWDRLDAPEAAGRMGGFYGLGESPRAPGADAILGAAQTLMNDLARSPVEALPAPLTAPAARIFGAMRVALTHRIRTGGWPRAPKRGMLERLRERWRRGKTM